MKTFKNILISLFLIFTVSLYWGQNILDSYNHLKSNIENTTNCSDTESIFSSESSLEQDAPFDFPLNAIQIANFGCENFISISCFFPQKLHYSIWLPPDIS